MSLSAFALPLELVFQILKKTNYESLCRLRQTNKQVYNFVESNRYKLTVRHPFLPLKLFLLIINKERIPCLSCSVIMHRNTWPSQISYHSDNNNPFDKTISDPKRQLSALKIDFATIRVFSTLSDRRQSIEAELYQLGEKEVYRRELLPLLSCLRIHCKKLYIADNEDICCMELLNYIHFEELSANPFNLSCEQIKMVTTRCDKMILTHIWNRPSSLLPLFTKCSSAFITLETEENCEDLFMDFLNDFCEYPLARGNLKTFHFSLGFFYGFHEFPLNDSNALVLLCRGEFEFLYKREVQDGLVVVLQRKKLYFVYLIENCRRALFDKMCSLIFYRTPYDCSAFYSTFLGTEDDSAVCQNIFNTYFV